MRSSRLVFTGAMCALLLVPVGVAARNPEPSAVGTAAGFAATINARANYGKRAVPVTLKVVNLPSGKSVKGYYLSENPLADPAPGATGWKLQPTSFTVGDADGAHTIYAWAKYTGGVVSAVAAQDNTFLDRVPPVVDTFTVPDTSTSRTISVTVEASDPGEGDDPVTGSGVVRYAVVNGTTAPVPGSTAWKTEAPTSMKLTKGNGTKTVSAFVRDAAGNVSLVSSDTVDLTLAGPSLTLTMPANTKTRSVAVNVQATDNGGAGIAGYIVKENNTVPAVDSTGWKVKPSTFTLSDSDGSHTVYAFVKDNNNIISSVASATTVLDRVKPLAILVITTSSPATNRTINVSAAGVDAGSGVAKYAIVRGTTAPTLASDWKNDPPTTFQLPLGNGTKTVSLFVKDAAGNVSDASTDTITMTIAKPTLTFNINPAWTSDLTVPVTLTPSDPGGTGIAGYYLSQSSTAPAADAAGWKIAPSTFKLADAADGTKTVYAWVKDSNGSVSVAAQSDTVNLDRTKPTATLTVSNDNTDAPTLSVSGTDSGSGVVYYTIVKGTTAPGFPNAQWKSTSGTVTVSLSSGAQTVTAFTRDEAGNVSAVVAGTNSKTVTVDPGTPAP